MCLLQSTTNPFIFTKDKMASATTATSAATTGSSVPQLASETVAAVVTDALQGKETQQVNKVSISKSKWTHPTTVATVLITAATALIIQLNILQSTVLSLALVILLSAVSLACYTVWYYRLPVSPQTDFFQNILLGHRGCVGEQFFSTENSISAMRTAVSYPSVHGVEFDVLLSADNVPVVFHDTDRVSRVCKEDPVLEKEIELVRHAAANMVPPSAGAEKWIAAASSTLVEKCNVPKIRNMTLSQIKRLQYRVGPEDERVPTLEEMITSCIELNPNMRMMIELKEFNKPVEMAAAIVMHVARFNLYDKAVIGSFNPVVLYHVRRMDPRIVTLLLVQKDVLTMWTSLKGEAYAGPDYSGLGPFGRLALSSKYFMKMMDWVLYNSALSWLPWFLGAGVIGLDNKLIKSGSVDVRKLQQRGYAINVWVVNDEEDKQRLRSMGGIAITTDFLFDL